MLLHRKNNRRVGGRVRHAVQLGGVLTLTGWCAGACAGQGDGAPSPANLGGGGQGTQDELCNETSRLRIVARETKNYRFESSIRLSAQRVAQRQVLEFDWSALSKNFLGQTLSNDEIAAVHLIMWKLSPEELAQALNDDALPQSRIEGVPLTFENSSSGARARLDEFGLVGSPISQADFEETVMPWFDSAKFAPERHTYTVIASKSTVPGADTQMISAFRLSESSENTTVALTDSSMVLEWQVDLSDQEPVEVPPSRPEIELSWSQIETNAMGREFDETSVTEVLIGAYSLGLEEIEERFIDLEGIADELYRLDVPAGRTADLSLATSDAGEPFPGIDDSRTWLVGLLCDECYNPAPWYLSRLTPCSNEEP